MKISKIIMKAALTASMTFGSIVGSVTAMDADIVNCHNIGVVKRLAQTARNNLVANPKLTLIGGTDVDFMYDKDGPGLIAKVRADYKAKIKTLVDPYADNDDLKHLLAATAVVGGMNQPADTSLGAFKTAINTVIDATVIAPVVFPVVAKYDYIVQSKIYGPIAGALEVDLTAFLEALGAAHNTVVLHALTVGGFGGGGFPQPANNQRDTFRDIVLQAISQ